MQYPVILKIYNHKTETLFVEFKYDVTNPDGTPHLDFTVRDSEDAVIAAEIQAELSDDMNDPNLQRSEVNLDTHARISL